MIAVTFALPAESSDFLRLLQGRTRGNDRVVTGTLHGCRVAVLHTGVGRLKAQARFARFVQRHKAELLLCSGFAGGINSALSVGDILLSENFSNPKAVAAATNALVQSRGSVGILATAPAMIDSAAERAAFAEKHQADAVDMETEFIAEIAGSIGLPMLALRAISDTAAAPFPAPPRVLFDVERQRTKLTTLLPYLLQNPAAIPRLAKFAQQVALARRSLTHALQLLIARGEATLLSPE
ncbi:MTA/SAH nucleosidase [soil metagenome]